MSYGRFAHVYDILMENVPYDHWVQLFEERMKSLHPDGAEVLDIACGTGEFSVRLAKRGYAVTGVDLSEEMLVVAKEKSENMKLSIPFYLQDMTELEMGKQYDGIVIFCDSLNYLQEEEDVKNTFRKVFEHLKEGGLFMFDVHSVHKVTDVFAGQTFADPYEEVSYIWNSYEGDEAFSVEHELSFFVKDPETGLYERFEEDHYQRTYPVETYRKWLEEAGFRIQEVFGDTDSLEEAERIYFTAVK